MLILRRRENEAIELAQGIIVIKVLEIDRSGNVQIGIEAPSDIDICRDEMPPAVKRKIYERTQGN